MKALLTFVCLLFCQSLLLAREGWLENVATAQAKAKQENKKVLLDFTGSDWCPWCVKLEREVFSKKEFKDYAAKNLVLVTVDFPQAVRQSAALKKQNEALAAKYRVDSFPTVIVLDANGRVTNRLDYTPGGPHAFLQQLAAKR